MNFTTIIQIYNFLKSVAQNPRDHWLNFDGDTIKGYILVLSSAFAFFNIPDANTIATEIVSGAAAVAGVIDVLRKRKAVNGG